MLDISMERGKVMFSGYGLCYPRARFAFVAVVVVVVVVAVIVVMVVVVVVVVLFIVVVVDVIELCPFSFLACPNMFA